MWVMTRLSTELRYGGYGGKVLLDLPMDFGDRVHAATWRGNLNFDRIYGMNGMREINGLNSAAKGMVCLETLCDAAKLRVISWDSRGPMV